MTAQHNPVKQGDKPLLLGDAERNDDDDNEEGSDDDEEEDDNEINDAVENEGKHKKEMLRSSGIPLNEKHKLIQYVMCIAVRLWS